MQAIFGNHEGMDAGEAPANLAGPTGGLLDANREISPIRLTHYGAFAAESGRNGVVSSPVQW